MSLRVRNVKVKSFVGGLLTEPMATDDGNLLPLDDDDAQMAVDALEAEYEKWRADSGERSLLDTHMSTESGRLILTVIYTD